MEDSFVINPSTLSSSCSFVNATNGSSLSQTATSQFKEGDCISNFQCQKSLTSPTPQVSSIQIPITTVGLRRPLHAKAKAGQGQQNLSSTTTKSSSLSLSNKISTPEKIMLSQRKTNDEPSNFPNNETLISNAPSNDISTSTRMSSKIASGLQSNTEISSLQNLTEQSTKINRSLEKETSTSDLVLSLQPTTKGTTTTATNTTNSIGTTSQFLASDISPLAQSLCVQTLEDSSASVSFIEDHFSTLSLDTNAASISNEFSDINLCSLSTSNTSTTVPFPFDTPSPDDIVMLARQGVIKQKKASVNIHSERSSIENKKTNDINGNIPKIDYENPAQSGSLKIPVISTFQEESSLSYVSGQSQVQVQPNDNRMETSTSKAHQYALSTTTTTTSNSSLATSLGSQMSVSRRKEIEKKLQEAQNASNQKESQRQKDHLNLVIIGHVDAGKSTLMGHLLYLLGNVPQKTMHKYERDSRNIGKGSFQYAWVLDQHEEERSRGITMDVGITDFETAHKRITLLDAPGHRDFIPNMISGASQADVAILVIDASLDNFEKGFGNDGQTKEHSLLAKSLGVAQMGVVINKMDMVDWSQTRFNEIVSKLSVFLRQSGFKESSTWYVPCSGFLGENLKECQEPKLKAWYHGPSLLEIIDQLQSPSRDYSKPFRLCISDSYKGKNFGKVVVAGRVEAGMISVGDKLLLMPVNELCTVKAIRFHNENAEYATAGDNIDISLAGVELHSLSTRNVLCDPEYPIPISHCFRAQIITFSLPHIILKGQYVELLGASVSEAVIISNLIAILEKSTGAIKKRNPRCLSDQTSAEIEIKSTHPLCIELYSNYKQLGRFTLREAGKTIASGIVIKLL